MIRTVVFDLDGTLVQTELLKGLSWARAAVELRPDTVTEGAVMTAYRSVVGRSREEVADAMMVRFGLPGTAADLSRQRLKHYEAMLADGELLRRNALPRNIDLVHRAKAAGKRLALGSMSHRNQVVRVLGTLGILDRFEFIAARDDVSKGKPDPEIYNLIMKKLGASPLESLAVEDSAAGIGAAVAAGLHCLAVPTDLTRDGVFAANLLSPQNIIEDPERVAHAFETMINAPQAALASSSSK